MKEYLLECTDFVSLFSDKNKAYLNDELKRHFSTKEEFIKFIDSLDNTCLYAFIVILESRCSNVLFESERFPQGLWSLE